MGHQEILPRTRLLDIRRHGAQLSRDGIYKHLDEVMRLSYLPCGTAAGHDILRHVEIHWG